MLGQQRVVPKTTNKETKNTILKAIEIISERVACQICL